MNVTGIKLNERMTVREKLVYKIVCQIICLFGISLKCHIQLNNVANCKQRISLSLHKNMY